MESRKQHGAALVELTIILVCLMFMTMGGLIVTFHLRTQIYALNIAGIASQLLYRECRFETPSNRASCMEKIKVDLEALALATGFQTVISLSYYQDAQIPSEGSPPYSTPILIHRTTQPVVIGNKSYNSSFTPFSLLNNATPHLKQHYERNGIVWISEVYVANRYRFGGLGNTVAYESTVS
jgi:hypothetical protein